MALSKEVYQALEAIVGPEYISDDPALLDATCYQRSAELITPDLSHFMPRAEAVLLPGSTEEVAAIVKTCNRYKIHCKAFSTGWISTACALKAGTIQLDLRRMDRILEIDEKNCFAIVEPYVISAQLQAEAMKRGLNCHMIGAGASCSVVATHTSLAGEGADSVFMGHGAENPLGMEWVTPTGDIMRTGSLGSGCGWFCSEGPGPSTRGIARGLVGGLGSWGVFTKVAVKLYHWPGPPVMPVMGNSSAYRTKLPRNVRAHTLSFPNNQAYADGMYKIFDAGIGYILHRQFNKFGEELSGAVVTILTDPRNKSIDMIDDLLKTPEVQKLTEELKCGFQIVLAGNSMEHIDYQEKVLDMMLKECGGRKAPTMEKPEMEEWVLMFLVRLPYKALNFYYGGGYWSGFGNPGTPDYTMGYFDAAVKVKKEHIAKGGIINDGANAFMGAISAIGGGGYLIAEQFAFFDSHDKKSIQALRDFNKDAKRICNEEMKLTPIMQGIGVALYGKEDKEKYCQNAPHPDVYRWQRKIHAAFDPNDVGDGGYIYLEEGK